ncbi:MAG: hypothetical protein HQL93_09970 [Magnetococcales bacterium]|nr:hypothetical protein [Magnetococcales bacterium]
MTIFVSANKRDIKPIWIDPDDVPELTNEWFEQADLYKDGKLVRRGCSTEKLHEVNDGQS